MTSHVHNSYTNDVYIFSFKVKGLITSRRIFSGFNSIEAVSGYPVSYLTNWSEIKYGFLSSWKDSISRSASSCSCFGSSMSCTNKKENWKTVHVLEIAKN